MSLPRPVLCASAATALTLLGDQALYAILPTSYRGTGLLPFQVGLLLSANRWIRLLTNRLAEWVCRRYPPRALLVAAAGVGSLLTLAYAFVASFALLLVARLLWGLCWSFIRQVGLTTVVEHAVEGRLSRTMGFYNGISRLGSVAGTLLGGLGHDRLGFTTILVVLGVASLAAAPVGLGVRTTGSGAVARPVARGGLSAGRALLWCGLVAGGVDMGMVMSTLGLLLGQRLGTGWAGPGFAIGVATITGALLAGRWVAEAAAPLLGSLADGIGSAIAAPVYLGLGGALLAGAAASSSVVAMAVLVLTFYVCAAGANVVLAAQAGTRGPRAVAGYVSAWDLGAACGPLAGWGIHQCGLPPAWILWIGSGLYLLAAAAAPAALRSSR